MPPPSPILPLTLLLLALSIEAFAQPAKLPADIYPGLRASSGGLIPAVSPYLGKEMTFYDEPVQKEMISRRKNFGYSDEEIQKYFSIPLHMPLDNTGINTEIIRPAPAPGIHPRVLFNPEDIPLIKKRLETTQAGKAIYGSICEQLKRTLTGPNAKLGPLYDALIKGDPELIDRLTLPYEELKKKYPSASFPEPEEKGKSKGDKPLGHPDRLALAVSVMYEAFRCLIDKDEAGGKKAAAAVTTLARISRIELEQAKARPKDDKAMEKEADKQERGILPGWWGTPRGESYQGTIGLDYDFAFPFMTDAQRSEVRGFLAEHARGLTVMGAETLRTLHTGTSNWVSWNNRFMFIAAAIEGEQGDDPAARERVFRSQTNYVHSIYQSGEAFEGWAKNFVMLEHLVIMAKRGWNICGSANLRSTFNDYYIASLNPWGNGFTFCDSQGASGCKIARASDVRVYHALFPNDLAGDFVYRNQVNGKYESGGFATGHPFFVLDGLANAIFAGDFSSETWEQNFTKVTEGRPLTYWSDDTGNMITRDAWSKEALYLNYLTRQIPGGHQYADRGHFSLYGLGRFWSIYHYGRQIGAQYSPRMRSVPLADDKGVSVMMGKSVAFADQPQATFTASDLSRAWNYDHFGMHPPKGVTKGPVPWSYNDFRLRPSPFPWMSHPIGELPDWMNSEKPKEGGNWAKMRDVKKAFRTAGLVRGTHPYAIIVEDLQLDDVEHEYEWGMVLADDLVLGSVKMTDSAAGRATCDIIIDEKPKQTKDEPAPANDRHLLVRVLSAQALKENAATVDTIPFPNPPQRDMKVNKLRVFSHSISPDFKLLLFPYRDGTALPLTTWNANHTAVTIAWKDQTDTITFTQSKTGRSLLQIVRDGREIVAVR